MILLIWSFCSGQEILEQSAARILLKITASEYEIIRIGDFTELIFPDWSYELNAGAPHLPQKMIKIGIPADGDIEYKIVSADLVSQQISAPVSPVPKIIESGKTHEFIPEIDQNKYSNTPVEHLKKGDVFHFRRFNIVPLHFSPVIYNYNRNEVIICREIILEINIRGNIAKRDFKPDKSEDFYSDFVINYDQARFWRTDFEAEIEKIPFAASTFWYRLETNGNGIYRISRSQLELLPDFFDINDLRLFLINRQVTDDQTLEYEMKLMELPLYISNHEVYFEMDNFDDPRLNLKQNNICWLTFGFAANTPPRRRDQIPAGISYLSVSSFERKIVSNSTQRSDLDGIIIYPQDGVFDIHSQQLADLHFELNFELKSQSSIFAEYAGGAEDPLAIKNYLAEKYAENTDLLYVVLMGSGTSFWNNTDEKNKIITYTDSFAADDNFCIFPGSSYPQLAIGRIPAKNESDMNFYLDRIYQYVQQPEPGFWRNKVLIIPDDENKSGGYEGFGNVGMNHSLMAQQTGDLITQDHKEIYVEKVMAIEYGFDVFQNKPDARNAMIDVINDGCLVWYFIGHGNSDVLGDEEYFRGSLHMNLLENGDRLPLFLAASCSVGEYDKLSFDCLAEKLPFHSGGGSIASIAAVGSCGPLANTNLMKSLLVLNLNDYPHKTIGEALWQAKLANSGNYSNNRQYHLLGDPLLYTNLPRKIGTISNPPDSIQARETVTINGDFGSGNQFNDISEIRIYEPTFELLYTNTNFVSTTNDTIYYTLNYTKEGNSIFKGFVQVNNGSYSSQFIVPDDAHAGTTGKTVNYLFDESGQKDYLSAYDPIIFSSTSLDVFDQTPPEVTLYLESKSFLPGDYVSTSPLLIADIEDENGINIVSAPGHQMLLLLDNGTELINVSSGFVYDLGSYTKGELTWQLEELSEGYHFLQLIVFDNFSNPQVAETNFIAKKSGKVAIEQLLPYPNPISKDGHFTFVITEDADITITIYTITGRKIRTIKKQACSKGYNQIYWDGKDGDGDYIANNTYFYKIRAKQPDNKKATEEIGKVIILK